MSINTVVFGRQQHYPPRALVTTLSEAQPRYVLAFNPPNAGNDNLLMWKCFQTTEKRTKQQRIYWIKFNRPPTSMPNTSAPWYLRIGALWKRKRVRVWWVWRRNAARTTHLTDATMSTLPNGSMRPFNAKPPFNSEIYMPHYTQTHTHTLLTSAHINQSNSIITHVDVHAYAAFTAHHKQCL